MDDMTRRIEESMLAYARKLTFSSHPSNPNSVFIGGFGIMDIPNMVDEFVRLWIISYEDHMKRWFLLRNMIEPFMLDKRFVTYTEYLKIFDDSTAGLLFSQSREQHSSNINKLHGLYPIYRMLNITTPQHRQKFINEYRDSLDGYFHLMGLRNPNLRTIISKFHDSAIPQQHRVHTYITGATRFGKSELMKVLIHDNIIKNTGAVVVMDPLGGFIQEVAQFKEIAKNPDRLVYIDPSLHKGDLVPVINPFEIEDKSPINVRITAEQIANSLIQIFDLEGQPLTTQMITILVPVISVIIRHGGNLSDVQYFVEEKTEKEKKGQGGQVIQGEIKPEDLKWTKRGMNDPDHSEFFTKRFHFVDSFRQSKESLISKMQHLTNYPLIRHVITGKSTINLKKAIEEEKIILINLSVGKQGGISPFLLGKFILSIIQDTIFQRAWIEKKERKPINFYIDEFGDFANASLSRILAQGGQFGFHLTVANQYLKQIKEEYRENLLANATVKFVGQNGHDTLSAMSRNLYIKEEELKRLDRGQFMTQITLKGKPFVVTTPTKLLGDKNKMSDNDWKYILKIQSKYYRKPDVQIVDNETSNHINDNKQNSINGTYNPKYKK